MMTDNGWDLCSTFIDAIRYWLWHCGVPAKVAFWRKSKPETKRYNCTSFLIKTRNDYMNDLGYPAGYANGYVAIPPDHPLHGKHYDTLDIEIHGGLTYSGSMLDTLDFCASNRLEDVHFIYKDAVPIDDYWVFGFDTIHAGDSLNTWPKERVIAETENLRKLLEDWGENED